MNSLLFQISSLTIFFGHSEAIPVPSRPFGDRNVTLLGVLTCIGVCAAVGMCVFCKKKKGHFKKFENDGNIEEVKNTEYPILKSLNSLDAKKTGAIIPSSPTNLSTDNLLDQTVQYQNESVSSQELDGIENYHLLQYQSEAFPKIQTARHVGKDNVSTGEQHLPPMLDDNDSNSNMLLSSKESLSSSSPLPGTKTSYSMEQETASLKNSVEFSVEKPLIDRCSTDIEVGIDEDDDSDQLDMAVQPPTRLDDVTISISEKASFYEEPTSGTATTKECGDHEDVTPMDSLEDNSSVHETNSIEEALRALDIAIDGEDESDDSDEEPSFVDYPEEIVKMANRNEFDRRNEICDEKNSSSDSGMDEIEMSEKVNSPDVMLHEMVREEATKLVDEVLLLCQSRIEEIRECEELERLEKNVPMEDDFDDFNSCVVLECSTPFVARKTTDLASSNPAAKLALFCDANEKTYVMADSLVLGQLNETSETKHEDECKEDFNTFIKPNVTYSTATKEEDDDLEQIYPVNETVTIKQVNITQTLASPFDTFMKEQGDNLPEIMIDGMMDDAVSDKPTATPMNTPIELGCPTTADWDRWLSASAAASAVSRDVQEHSEEDYFAGQTYDEGWFLHAQPGSSNTNDGNETYDLDENNDNLDSTYDLLRKQLAEMLPHAQGAKESVECLEE